MALRPPSVKIGIQAPEPDRTLRLSELRELVDETRNLPAIAAVRAEDLDRANAELRALLVALEASTNHLNRTEEDR